MSVAASELLLGFRFGVLFLVGGLVPNPLDLRFQKVKGLSARVETTSLQEGGQNLYTQQLPTGMKQGTLILERGMVVGSPLNLEFVATMSLFSFSPCNVMVFLFNESSVPVACWLFNNAYPLSWTTSDLDASEKNIVIDTMELAYQNMTILRI